MENFRISELTLPVFTDESVAPLEDLRLLTVCHRGFDGADHQGELIVHESVAEEVLEIFKELHDLQFPIEKIQLVSRYDYSDDLSMAANNSSGFNFRKVQGTNHLSWHAYGLAIDINPRINPYILASGEVLPHNGERYTDRGLEVPGMILEDSPVVKIFKSYGWEWGGDWDVVKDYQHFQKPM